MRITNKNVHIWLMCLSVPFFWYLPDVIGLYEMFPGNNCDGECPTLGNFLYYVIKFLSGVWGMIVASIGMDTFFTACKENKIQFDIDLLALFRSRHVKPEDEDKKKK